MPKRIQTAPAFSPSTASSAGSDSDLELMADDDEEEVVDVPAAHGSTKVGEKELDAGANKGQSGKRHKNMDLYHQYFDIVRESDSNARSATSSVKTPRMQSLISLRVGFQR